MIALPLYLQSRLPCCSAASAQPAAPPAEPPAAGPQRPMRSRSLHPVARNQPGRPRRARNPAQKAGRLFPGHHLAHRSGPARTGQADPRRTRRSCNSPMPSGPRWSSNSARSSMLQLARVKGTRPGRRPVRRRLHERRGGGHERPQAIAALVAQLADPSAGSSRRWPATIWPPPASPASSPCSKRWHGNRSRHAAQAFARAARRMDPLVVGPLLAMLDTRDATLRFKCRRDSVEPLRRRRKPFRCPTTARLPRSNRCSHAIDRTARGMPPFSTGRNRTRSSSGTGTTRPRNSPPPATRPTKPASSGWPAWPPSSRDVTPDNRDYSRQALLLELEAAALVATPGSQPPANRLQSADARTAEPAPVRRAGIELLPRRRRRGRRVGERGHADVLLLS